MLFPIIAHLLLVLGIAVHGALGRFDQSFPKQLAAVRRRPGLTHKEFLYYHTLVHGLKAWNAPRDDAFAAAYTQNYAFDSVFGVNNSVPNAAYVGRDDVAELWSSSPTTFTSPSNYTQEVIGPDGANFNDLPAAFSIFGIETFVRGSASTPTAKAPASEKGHVVVFFWASATSESVSNDTFARGVADALLTRLPSNAVYRASIHVPVPGVDIRPYFGGEGLPTISSVIKLWLHDGDAAVTKVRAVQTALDYKGLHLDENVSFMMFTRAVTIWDLDRNVPYDDCRLRASLQANTY
ncbi:hypothetical protein EDB81DRAFT_884091 [Dactylonectria macrodidyma]|uniref:EthD domain-containing protein n=1 Tax=Dactylonectria macrodidyma TaxID=307937 RepID=A0A9P9J5I0_9HYPO|nr:hypothetical protein EDB81DRAFT_884091 [Dactylonectria macrodidyma]